MTNSGTAQGPVTAAGQRHLEEWWSIDYDQDDERVDACLTEREQAAAEILAIEAEARGAADGRWREHREVCHNADPDAVIAHLHGVLDALAATSTTPPAGLDVERGGMRRGELAGSLLDAVVGVIEGHRIGWSTQHNNESYAMGRLTDAYNAVLVEAEAATSSRYAPLLAADYLQPVLLASTTPPAELDALNVISEALQDALPSGDPVMRQRQARAIERSFARQGVRLRAEQPK